MEVQATIGNSGKVCEEKIHADEVKMVIEIRLKMGYERKHMKVNRQHETVLAKGKIKLLLGWAPKSE